MALSVEYELANLVFNTMVLHRDDHQKAMSCLKQMGDLIGWVVIIAVAIDSVIL